MADHTALGHVPLTPLTFLSRAEFAAGDATAVVDGSRRFTYSALAARARRMAGLLAELGADNGQTVSTLTPNTSLALEAHYGIPLAGGVINALNTRLHAAELATIVRHAEARVLLAHPSLADLAREVVDRAGPDGPRLLVADHDYERALASASPRAHHPASEDDLLSLNYTSGTTGRPKGVMYTHRGATLQALAMTAHTGMGPASAFLWTLPMFHCNGWCFPWAVTAATARHVMLQRPDPDPVWDALLADGVTHFNAAPTVLSRLVASSLARPLPRPVQVATGGAPPSPRLIDELEALNITVTHLYGLTESYGPAVICVPRPEWQDVPPVDRAELVARQGVANIVTPPVRILTHEGTDAPHDGSTSGEVLLGGPTVMAGYFKDPESTLAAVHDGWLRTGDVGVIHPDGYLQLLDRAKDIIISGGENIASIEVEHALAAHPAVHEVAVVAAPHDDWGEVPVAFVEFRDGHTATEGELIDHVRTRLAAFKAPTAVRVEPLPRTATGKIRKVELRERLGQATPTSGAPRARG